MLIVSGFEDTKLFLSLETSCIVVFFKLYAVRIFSQLILCGVLHGCGKQNVGE